MCIDDGVKVWVGPWRGFKFSAGEMALSTKAFSSSRSSLTQTFVESGLDFEVAHLSVLMVWRLPWQLIAAH